jgi:hypothetical protein
MKHTKRNSAQQPGHFFFHGQSWVRLDESGSQQLADEFGHVAYTHGPRHAKAHGGVLGALG